MSDPIEKIFGDIASFGILIATLLQYLPTATAIVSFAWVVIRVYETATAQSLIDKVGKGIRRLQ